MVQSQRLSIHLRLLLKVFETFKSLSEVSAYAASFMKVSKHIKDASQTILSYSFTSCSINVNTQTILCLLLKHGSEAVVTVVLYLRINVVVGYCIVGNASCVYELSNTIKYEY